MQNEMNLQWDQTELPDLDVLGDPTGVLFASQENCAKLFGAAESFYLINGASVGLMAALLALDSQKGPVLIARNAHRSVVHGLVLSGLEPIWLLPEENKKWGVWGEIGLSTIQEVYKTNPHIQAVVLTHPTYEGITSDITAIADWCREQNLLLIVDEAHGALWNLSDQLPISALSTSADVVIHSLHKSAGALTQSAVLHLSETCLINPSRIQQALNLLQTTSPSYLLLSSIEATCQFFASHDGQKTLHYHIKRCLEIKHFINSQLHNIQCMSPENAASQLLIQHTKLSAEALATVLEEEYDIAFESLNEKSVLLHLNIGLPDEAFDALKQALISIDLIENADSALLPEQIQYQFSLPKMGLTPRQAFLSVGETVEKENAVGRIARQIIASCPPGIPVLMPGELVSTSHLSFCSDTIDVVSKSLQ